MSVRLLLRVLAPMLSDHGNDSTFEKIETSAKDLLIDFQTPAKFHIGMLSISLIIGLAFGGFITYKTWKERDIFLGYIRNLVIALVCRTFFSILFDGVILLGEPLNVAGGNALLAFEQIFLNLVLAFWLTLTIYIHARVQKNFDREPELRLFQYGVPGVAVFFAFVWIFTLQNQVPSVVWWIFLNPFTQWMVNSLNLLYLLIQLALIGDIVRMMMKISLDNDSISLLRYITIMMGALVLIFWLQFGFVLGRIPLQNSTSYLYFHYFIDGSEGVLVCLLLYFFSKWVFILLKKISSLMLIGNEETSVRTSKSTEVLLSGRGDRRLVTIDSVFMTNESKRCNFLEKEGTKDVVYSNVVEPERLKKTLELYKRFDILPSNRVTVVEGEEFYDCQIQSSLGSNEWEERKLTKNQLQRLRVSKRVATSEDINFRHSMVCKQTQKKNAFYSSKYLILDSKESDIPKYLETRPSVSSLSGKDSLKDERQHKGFPSSLDSLMSDELVRKWLLDNSENMRKNDKNKMGNCQIDEKDSCQATKVENSDSKMSKHSEIPRSTEEDFRQKDNHASMPQTIFSTISSFVPKVLFRSSKSERRNSDKEQNVLSAPDEINTAVSEQNGAIKPVETVRPSKPEIAECQKKEEVKENETSYKIAINADINVEPRNKVETVKNAKEILNFQFSEYVSDESLHNLKSETNERPEKFIKKPVKSAEKKKLNRANDTESILSEENNGDISVQPIYPEPLEFRIRKPQLITEQQPQVSKEQFKKLTEFLPENKRNDSNFETENKNICESLNVENEKENLEPPEPQTDGATVAYKTEPTETNENGACKPLHDLKLDSEQMLSETVMEPIPTDSIRKQKPEDAALTPSDVQNSNKSAESLDQYITYSELLNFRSQRDKEVHNQPSFNFSDAVFLAIDSLINASGNFFFSNKNYADEEKFQKVEEKEIEKSNENLMTNSYQIPQDETEEKLGNLQGVKNEQQDIANKTPNFETENENVKDCLNFENKTEAPKEPESYETQIYSSANGRKAKDERTRVLSEALHDSELEPELSAPNFKINKDISPMSDTAKEQTLNCEKNTSTAAEDLYFSQPLKFQSQQDESTTPYLSKGAENLTDFENEIEQQSKTFKITKKTPALKNETPNDTEKHNQTYETEEHKSFGKFNESIVTGSDIKAKIQKPYVEQLEQSQGESCKVLTPPENDQISVNETSSDSEFGIEKRKESSSSNSSFSLDRYYAEIMNVQKKFQNPSASVRDKQTKKLKIHK